MLVGIHQLHYLPWLRYFEKIARCDVFIVLDDIQFTKNDWQNRNKVKTASGATLLTVPVFEHLGQNLGDVRIKRRAPWRRKHWRTIEQAYHKAPFLADHAAFLSETYGRDWGLLNDLNRHMLEYFVHVLGIDTRLVYASGLEVPGKATDRLVKLVQSVDGDCYYSGAYAARAYLDTALFKRAGIGLRLQQWAAPTYAQLHGHFVPDLAVVDLLLNCGPESLGILMGVAP